MTVRLISGLGLRVNRIFILNVSGKEEADLAKSFIVRKVGLDFIYKLIAEL